MSRNLSKNGKYVHLNVCSYMYMQITLATVIHTVHVFSCICHHKKLRRYNRLDVKSAKDTVIVENFPHCCECYRYDI